MKAVTRLWREEALLFEGSPSEALAWEARFLEQGVALRVTHGLRPLTLEEEVEVLRAENALLKRAP